jgi:long-chain fatty acid transport protein
MCTRNFLLVVLLFFIASSVFAITDEEQFRSLNLELRVPGARARAMGGAFIGLADDTSATEINPAGLARIKTEIAVDFGRSPSRSYDTTVSNIPVSNFDPDPTLPPIAPGDPVFATFTADHTIDDLTSFGFIGTTVRMSGFSFAVARNVRIDTDMTLSGATTASPFHFVEQNAFAGSSSIRVVNYIFSIAKGGSAFSAGAGLKITNLDYETSLGARQKQQTGFGEHFTLEIDQVDEEVGFNAGILIHPGNTFALGIVYNFEPEFDVQTLVNNVDNNLPFFAEKKVKFNIPDSFGIGISLRPSSNFTLNADLVRVLYSQFEPVETGMSIFTHVLPEGEQIEFGVKDKNDYHIGGEVRVPIETGAVALRGGWYRQGSSRTFLEVAGRVGVRSYLQPIYDDDSADPITHYTFGAGVDVTHFGLDVAVDFRKEQSIDENVGQLVRKREVTEGGMDLMVSSRVKF